MPPRLGNKKSRNGCVRCKARKVKCDELSPACGWCREHGFRCEYARATKLKADGRQSVRQPSASSPMTTTSSESLTSSSCPVLDEKSPQRRSLELGLLHYYITTVAPTFPYVDREYGLKLHTITVPQQGLRHSSLLNAMYAYALLHLHIRCSTRGDLPSNADFFEGLGLRVSQNPNIARTEEEAATVDLLTLHSDYLDRAALEQRSAVANVTANNADAVCVSAILIGMIELVHSSQIARGLEKTHYSLPLQWFHLCRSFSHCLDVARPLLAPESATQTMVNAYPRHVDVHLQSSGTSRFRHLLDWQPSLNTELLDSETVNAYQKPVTIIETVYQHIMDGEPWEALGRLVLAFPNIVPNLFVLFIEQRRPRALVILGHLLAMTKSLDELWWVFQGVADFHVRGLAELVSEEWQWALTWPLQVLSEGVK